MAFAERHKKRLDKRYTDFFSLGRNYSVARCGNFPFIKYIYIKFQGLETGKWVFVGFDNFKAVHDEWFGKTISFILYPDGYNRAFIGYVLCPFIK